MSRKCADLICVSCGALKNLKLFFNGVTMTLCWYTYGKKQQQQHGWFYMFSYNMTMLFPGAGSAGLKIQRAV